MESVKSPIPRSFAVGVEGMTPQVSPVSGQDPSVPPVFPSSTQDLSSRSMVPSHWKRDPRLSSLAASTPSSLDLLIQEITGNSLDHKGAILWTKCEVQNK
ncbi:unnamed protein product [Urochloa humidicola]